MILQQKSKNCLGLRLQMFYLIRKQSTKEVLVIHGKGGMACNCLRKFDPSEA